MTALVIAFFEKRFRTRLTEGLVLTIEPLIALGSGREKLLPDGWAVATEITRFPPITSTN